ncbi:MAG: single-stranded-DNA-specific exonuclease RecJ [Oscillospiraceae bacterium]|nr:single-stranded-DNA-specific exonuclease RecJ [Oscillospiraceae bacterium]
MKKWTLPSIGEGREIREKYGDFLGGILLADGFMSNGEIDSFFGCNELSDPFLMTDMKKAVEVISASVENGEKIVVYGDYDCDGVTSAVMLYGYLEMVGAEVEFYIPERSDGFGMNIPALERLTENGAQLIITVDNGISANKEAQFLKEKGVKLVITDHHRQNGELPICEACVNPNREDDVSPFKDLCGAGVTLKLLIALEGDSEFILESYADLAAVGTIGDVMPLCGENRYIVRRGLEQIKNEQNIGLMALCRMAGIKSSKITTEDIAFKICPRINCAGRISSAAKAAYLLLSDTPESAEVIAEELNTLNSERKALNDEIYAQIEEQLSEDPRLLSERVIVLVGNNWNVGIIGLVCSKITEKYGKPTVVISVENKTARGSCRSVGNFSIHKMLMSCAEVLTNFGGHPMAGGFSLDADNVEALRSRILSFAREHYPIMPDPELLLNRETKLEELSVEKAQLIERLGPFGEGNRRPLLLFRDCTVSSKAQMSGGKYISFTAKQGNASVRAFSFDFSYADFYIGNGARVDIAAYAEINEYGGNTSVELRFVDFRPSGFEQDRFFAAKRAYDAIRTNEGCDGRLFPRVVPQSREDLMKIYDLLKNFGERMTLEQLAVYDSSVNYCMLRITADAFVEAGMLKKCGNYLKTVSVSGKRDMFKEGLLSKIAVRDGRVAVIGDRQLVDSC